LKVLVTGVSGFVGSFIAETLASQHDVWGIYRKTRPKHLEHVLGLNLIQDDLCEPHHLPETCDYVIHAAADTPATTSSEEQLWKSNRDGIGNLLDWCSLVGVRYFLFYSTVAVYGNIEDEWIDESTPSCHPNAYGASKLAAERLLWEYTKNHTQTHCLTIRLPGVVGREARDTFLPRTVQKILIGEPITVYSKQAHFNNVVHIDDLAIFSLRWTENLKGSDYPLINVASSLPITLEQVALTLMKTLGKKVPIVENGSGKPPFLIRTTLANHMGFPDRRVKDVLTKYASERLKLKQLSKQE